MFGLEKKQKQLFEFALEEDLKSTPEKKQSLIQEIETMIQSIKTQLRTGTNSEDFDDYGVLLHGYSALLRVIHRISPNK